MRKEDVKERRRERNRGQDTKLGRQIEKIEALLMRIFCGSKNAEICLRRFKILILKIFNQPWFLFIVWLFYIPPYIFAFIVSGRLIPALDCCPQMHKGLTGNAGNQVFILKLHQCYRLTF